ncbi:CGNR zinc finger domain-containing protein [Streptomyces sp. SAI-229]|uniref:CGNR zinc finger domain-containing protein n=1 Tax=Streptomyces sp. SAI-229 TaxID=3377731 RepID=UPI003C79D7DA
MLDFALSCEACGGPLTGNQTAVCSNKCRQARKRARKLTDEQREALLWGRDCANPGCAEVFDPRSRRQKYCSPICANKEKADAEDARWDAICELDGCEDSAGWDGTGRARRFCSNAHKQKAYRLRKKANGTA